MRQLALKSASFAVGSALLVAATPVSAGMADGKLLQTMRACQNAALDFKAATDTFRSHGWTAAPSRKAARVIANHVAAGVHYRSDKPSKSQIKKSAKQWVETQGTASQTNELRRTTFRGVALFQSGSGDFLAVLEDIVTDQNGKTLARGRSCYLAIPQGSFAKSNRAYAKPRGAFLEMPRSSVSFGGRQFRLSGRYNSFPATGIGFPAKATEFIQLNLRS
jgi:hypothetical protein